MKIGQKDNLFNTPPTEMILYCLELRFFSANLIAWSEAEIIFKLIKLHLE